MFLEQLKSPAVVSARVCVLWSKPSFSHSLCLCSLQPQSCKGPWWTKECKTVSHACTWAAESFTSVTPVTRPEVKPFAELSLSVKMFSFVQIFSCRGEIRFFVPCLEDRQGSKSPVLVGKHEHWTEVDVLRRGFDPGRGREENQKPGVRWVTGHPPVHSYSPCAAANTWWKVKVQWGVSIFTRIMLCLSCSLSHTLDPPRFISLLSFPRVIHVRTRVVAPLSTSDPVRFNWERQSIHNSLHFVSMGPVWYVFLNDLILYAFVAFILLRRRRLRCRLRPPSTNVVLLWFFISFTSVVEGFVGAPPKIIIVTQL